MGDAEVVAAAVRVDGSQGPVAGLLMEKRKFHDLKHSIATHRTWCARCHGETAGRGPPRADRICSLLPYSSRLAGVSRTDVVLSRQGRLARHTLRATARFVGQSFCALLQKPLYPFVENG
jgi:hypothetical protein